MKQVGKAIVRAMVMIFVSISINFWLIHLMPGDPVMHILGEDEYFALSTSYPEKIEEVRSEYELDGSLWEQYGRYLYNVVTLEFGHSYVNGSNVMETVCFRMKCTLLLAVTSIVISAIVGGVLGVLAGYRKGGSLDRILTAVCLVLETIPANCLALIALVLFAYKLRWFPVGGMMDGGVTGMARLTSLLYHMVLPVTVLSLFRTSSNFLMMKSYVSQLRDETYIAVATAKGLPERKILFRHLMRNAWVPYVTTLCVQFGHVLSGSMLVEVVFSWKGMGTLIYESVLTKDYPTVQLCFLVIAVCVIGFNFIGDVLCVALDPRIKDGVQNA